MTKVFIGSSSNGEDSEIESVLAYTLHKNCPDVDITWMRQGRGDFWDGFTTHRWSTPFSGFRWAIPEYMNFEGRAVYMDVDQINFRDISILANMDLERRPFAARRGTRFGGHEFCVMVIDCRRAGEWLVPVERQRNLADYHHRCINTFSGDESFVAAIDPRWNCLDGEGLPLEDIWHLHWTKMSTQPWKPAWFTGIPEEHPRRDLVAEFERLKEEALRAGCPPPGKPNYPEVKYDIIGR